MDLPAVEWRKSTRSQSQSDCVEVALVGKMGAVRDSKNPHGPTLAVGLAAMLSAVRSGGLDH